MKIKGLIMLAAAAVFAFSAYGCNDSTPGKKAETKEVTKKGMFKEEIQIKCPDHSKRK